MLLKVEKRCQTTIEKILKSIVDERRSPVPLVERIYVRRAANPESCMGSAIKGCPCNRQRAYMVRIAP